MSHLCVTQTTIRFQNIVMKISIINKFVGVPSHFWKFHILDHNFELFIDIVLTFQIMVSTTHHALTFYVELDEIRAIVVRL